MLDYGQVTEFYVLFALKGFCFGAFAYLPRAMLADVVDFDTVRSGTARPASYFAILGFMTKCAASFGGLSLPILGFVGYSVARNVTNGPTELMWLGILYAIVPTLMFVVAFYLCVTWPLDAKLHQRLERLVARKQARYSKDSVRA
jgi:Na+/melibiose symporter-like transporter